MHQPVDRLQVDRRILADRGVRAAAGFHADDALGRQRFVRYQELCVFLGIDVVGDDRQFVALAQRATKRERQRRLAGADGSADADAERLRDVHGCGWPCSLGYDRKRREYCVSCRDEAIASPGANVLMSSSAIERTSVTTAGILAPACMSMRCPATCPRGIVFIAAST